MTGDFAHAFRTNALTSHFSSLFPCSYQRIAWRRQAPNWLEKTVFP